jgi:hypothetical protein
MVQIAFSQVLPVRAVVKVVRHQVQLLVAMVVLVVLLAQLLVQVLLVKVITQAQAVQMKPLIEMVAEEAELVLLEETSLRQTGVTVVLVLHHQLAAHL